MLIPKFNYNHLKDVLNFIIESEKRGVDVTIEGTIEYFGKSRGYTNNSVMMLKTIGMIQITPDGIKLNDIHHDRSAPIQIKEAILSFQPFVEFLYFSGKGKSSEESGSMVKHLYKIDTSSKVIERVFLEMQAQLGMSKTIIHANESLLEEEFEIKNISQATLYIKEQLKHFYHDIPAEIVKDFISAIQVAEKDPSSSVTNAGRGLEDFFRLVLVKDINLKKRNGLGQIAIALNENQAQYPVKLNNLVGGLASIRSMGNAHGADKKILERWAVTPETARAFIALCLNTIRGYLNFRQTNKLSC